MHQANAFGFTLGRIGIDEKSLEQLGWIVDRRNSHTRPCPTHIRSPADAGINRGKPCFTSDVRGCRLIERDILFRETGRLLFSNAAQESLNRFVTTVELVIQI